MNTLWLHITSGTGPEECARAAALTYGEILKEAAAQKIQVSVLTEEPSGVKGNFRSVLLCLEGEAAGSFARSWTGVIKWVWRSEYRPGHKRKNWFVGVACYAQRADESVFAVRDVEIKTTRASGPGGQHVNKTESAVQATHIPSGKSVRAQEERSQTLNKKLALARLAALLEEEAADRLRERGEKQRMTHYSLERGNPLRVYSASPVKLLQRNNQ